MMQAKDISDKTVLEYLAERQGKWTSLWDGSFLKYPEGKNPNTGEVVDDVYYAMPKDTPSKVALAKMKALHRRGLVGGCPCGCRGDFEITDKGLKLIDQKRTKPYTGY